MKTSTENLVLKATDVTITRDGRQILDHVSLTLPRGKIITVIGPNGSGKTTLVQALMQMIELDKGSIWYAEDVSIAYMPQKITINPMLPLTVQRFVGLHTRLFSPTAQKVQEALHLVGIEHLKGQQISSLSGGEWQRMMLAHALVQDPNILILDEPTQAMDVKGQINFYTLIANLQKERHLSVLMVSHDLHMVMRKTDHVYCLHHHVCCQGSPEDVSQDDHYRRLFGDDQSKILGLYTHHHDHSHD